MIRSTFVSLDSHVAVFAPNHIKEEGNKMFFFFFCATFKQLWLQKATFDLLRATFEHLFEKLRATFWEISSNLWKALQ